MDVNLPDGTVIRGVPDGMSKADLVLKLKNNGYDVSKLDAPAAPAPQKRGMIAQFGEDAKQTLLAGLDGAAGIGATLSSPLDALTGYKTRREDVAGGLAQMGYDPNHFGGKAAKLSVEIAGTGGTGGLLAKGAVKALPSAATASPRVAQALEALKSGGFTLGGQAGTTLAGKAGDLGIRALAGGVSGAGQAALINPNEAGTGAAVGFALPGILKAGGMAGNKLGSVLRGPEQSMEMKGAIQAARDIGYVIPPTQARPTLTNRVMEGFAGKLTTAQNASAKNQEVTNKLAAQALGLAPDVNLTPDVLNGVRKTAGQAYESIRGAGMVAADAAFDKAIADVALKYKTAVPSFPGLGKTNMHGQPVDEIADLVKAMQTSRQFDASETIDAIGMLRESADKAFRGGNKTLGKATKTASDALEDLLGRHVEALGNGPMLDSFQQARKLIAKTYTVEKALNATTGSVDARKLAAALQRGKPLTGELRQAGEFANRFPKAAQTIEGMGSLPQTSPLDWVPAGALSMATSNPLMMAGVAARPMARSAVLSGPVQNRLVQGTPSNALAGLMSPDVLQFGYRAAPVLGVSR